MPLPNLEGMTILKVIELPSADAVILVLEGGLKVVVNDARKSVYR